ncbi:hypothetical protein [Sinomonas humi]|uniref:PhiRv1 phage protein n=1 Tax=Sinomonas humi TaxID=1338436 RepID=A0A0B2AF06_9MICC|nr:hypothetical protein [Sinomonas humi]KHL00433.1 hypothetical protein LK10_19675 [Sinomonas humi]
MSSEVVQAKSRLGVAARRRDPEEIAEARRDLAAAKLAQYVERVVSAAPPLTPEQADRIAALLRGSACGR